MPFWNGLLWVLALVGTLGAVLAWVFCLAWLMEGDFRGLRRVACVVVVAGGSVAVLVWFGWYMALHGQRLVGG